MLANTSIGGLSQKKNSESVGPTAVRRNGGLRVGGSPPAKFHFVSNSNLLCWHSNSHHLGDAVKLETKTKPKEVLSYNAPRHQRGLEF